MLIEEGNKLILVDNGIGNKQDARFFSHYYNCTVTTASTNHWPHMAFTAKTLQTCC